MKKIEKLEGSYDVPQLKQKLNEIIDYLNTQPQEEEKTKLVMPPSAGKAINFMVVEKSAVIKFDKHVASRVFSPDELENLDSYMMKYRKYGIVELLDNKLAGVVVSAAPAA